MLTLFTMPKPFKGHIGMIQRNAIGSWKRLNPHCEVILIGNEEGTAEVAQELGVRHIPEVARNEYGTPLLNDIFERTKQWASYSLLCYVNCDIILGSEFIRAVEKVSRWRRRFLMIGECWNLDVAESLSFDQPDWEKRLQCSMQQSGRPRGPWAVDYFVFSRRLYKHIPPFAIGRAYFDNWLIWKARAQWAAVVDATQVVLAVHQNHDYSHVTGGKTWTLQGEEAKQNFALAGGLRHRYCIYDSTHSFGPFGLRWNFQRCFRLKYRWKRSNLPIWGWWIVEVTRPIRHFFGLKLHNLKRFRALLTRQ